MNSPSHQLGNGTRNDTEEQAPEVGKVTFPWDWNIIIILVRMIALSLEPLFLYGLMINEYKKCVEIDKKLGITAIVSRSFLDISYLVLRFHTGFLGNQFRKYRRKLKNKLHAEKKGAASRPTETMASTDPIDSSHSTLVKDLRKYFLHQHLLFDILVFLPIPQVVMLCILLDVRAMKSLKTLQILNIFIFFQYWPRVFQIYLPRKDLGSNHELLGERQWVLGPLDFFLYIIAGHVLGAFWYCFSIQRTVACWYMACENHGGCVRNSFYYCNHNFGYHSVLDDFCPKNMPNAELFDFGVYLDSHQSNILRVQKYSTKNILLFLLGHAKSETCMQRRKRRKRRKRQEANIELWLSKEKVPTTMKSRIIGFIHNRFDEDEDVNVENLIPDLPLELQSDVKRHICLNLLKNLNIITKNGLTKHQQLLLNICDSLKPVFYNEQSYIVKEGDPIDAVFLITYGIAWTYPSSNNGEGKHVERLDKGHFFGEELLELLLNPSSVNADNLSKLPVSSKTLKTHMKVEVFALMANDLKDIVSAFPQGILLHD